MDSINDINAGLELQVNVLSSGIRYPGERAHAPDKLRNQNNAAIEIDKLLYRALFEDPTNANALVLQLHFKKANLVHSGFRGNLRRYLEDGIAPSKDHFNLNLLLNLPFRAEDQMAQDSYSPIRFFTSYGLGMAHPVLELDLSVVPNLVRGQINPNEIQKIYFARVDRQKMSQLYQQDNSLGAPWGTLENYLRFRGYMPSELSTEELRLLCVHGGKKFVQDHTLWLQEGSIESYEIGIGCLGAKFITAIAAAVPVDTSKQGTGFLFEQKHIPLYMRVESDPLQVILASSYEHANPSGILIAGNKEVIKALHQNYSSI
ncbi:MAG: hypothetical protein ABIJ34_04015 [archaeon]